MAVGGRGEMAYAAGLGPVGGDTVGVQIPPPALKAAPSAQGGTSTPQPSLSSLTLQLIVRVTALLKRRILLSFHP